MSRGTDLLTTGGRSARPPPRRQNQAPRLGPGPDLSSRGRRGEPRADLGAQAKSPTPRPQAATQPRRERAAGPGPGSSVTGRLNRWQSNSPAAAELARLQPMSRTGPGPGPETLSLNRQRPELGNAARSRPRGGQPSPVPAGPGPGAAFSSEISTLALPVYINRFNFGTLKILKRINWGTANSRSSQQRNSCGVSAYLVFVLLLCILRIALSKGWAPESLVQNRWKRARKGLLRE